MQLLFDAGNTFLKCGVYQDKILSFSSLGCDHLEDGLIEFLNQAIWLYSLTPRDTPCFLVSVNLPVSTKVLKILKYMGFTVKKFSKKMDIGFRSLYAAPTLGDDRVVTDYGAFSLYGGKLIVVDLGTAATFDLLDETGLHLGGAIMPGKEPYQGALIRNARVLPHVSMKAKPQPLGDSTISNLESGLYYGFIGSVLHMIHIYKSQMEFSDYRVILTGGDIELFSGCPEIDILDRELTLKGLAQIFNERINP